MDGRPKCCAMASRVMKVWVFREIICDPLSETASRIGVSPSSASGSTRPVPARGGLLGDPYAFTLAFKARGEFAHDTG